MTRMWWAAGILSGLLVVAGCDEAARRSGLLVVPAADVQAMLELTLQDENRAETIYQGV